MPWWQCRPWSISPVLNDRLLFVVKVRTVFDHLRYLLGVTGTRVKVRHSRRTKLGPRAESERRDEPPVRPHVTLCGRSSLPVRNQKWLPAIGIDYLEGTVDRLITRVIRIGAGCEIAELVCTV